MQVNLSKKKIVWYYDNSEVIFMESRMDRYNQTDNSVPKRSDKNVQLYHTIYDTPEYSNIEGIATIDKSNEIDILKVKKMLQNRESYQQGRDYRNLIQPKEEVSATTTFLEEDEEEKNYDIRDILNKAKSSKSDSSKYHNLENTSYKVLKNLNIERPNRPVKEERDLKGLIDTITSTSILNKMDDRHLSLDLLGDLRSENNTVIENKDAIKQLLEQAKQEEMRRKKMDEPSEMDKSFYTSSLGFGEEDFEQLADINHNLRRNNILMKILLITLGIVVLIAGIIVIFNFLK